VSFVYERGWRQGFAQAGFPGVDQEVRRQVALVLCVHRGPEGSPVLRNTQDWRHLGMGHNETCQFNLF
jgi:hypothetical protein